jgi:hypothetical protein
MRKQFEIVLSISHTVSTPQVSRRLMHGRTVTSLLQTFSRRDTDVEIRIFHEMSTTPLDVLHLISHIPYYKMYIFQYAFTES